MRVVVCDHGKNIVACKECRPVESPKLNSAQAGAFRDAVATGHGFTVDGRRVDPGEVMNKTGNAEEKARIMKNDEWVPEVGQKCEIKLSIGAGEYDWFEGRITAIGELHALVHADGMERSVILDCVWIRPIQSKADKERDEQINLIHNLPSAFPCEYASQFYDKGVRVLKPGQDVGRMLSDDELQEVIENCADEMDGSASDLTIAIKRAIFGEGYSES